MAKLGALPALAIIKGFRGVIDYYYWNVSCDRTLGNKSIPCCRKWPRSPGHDRSPSVQAQWSPFAWASSNWNSLAPIVREAYEQTVVGTSLTARDLFTKSFITDYFREGQWD